MIEAWKKLCKTCTKTERHYAEARKLCAEYNTKIYKFNVQGYKLRNEIDAICAEANKLRAEARIQFLDAVLKELGNVTIKWSKRYCVVAGNLTFTYGEY